MIALDAGVLIAYITVRDARHATAAALLEDNAERALVINPVNMAEVLVSPARAGRLEEVRYWANGFGLSEVPLPPDASVRLAELRATTGLTLPDCCVLLTAQQTNAAVATFDSCLAKSAKGLGIDVL